MNHDAMSFAVLQRKARLRLLKLHYDAQCGHLGGNLSCLDILLYLHHCVMKPEDVFILSKGHAAGALYVTLWTLGRLSEEELSTFHQDGGLCGHITSKHGTFGTGSLGHGLSLARGMAIVKELRGETGNVYCLLGDGEMEEGSVAEPYLQNFYFGNPIIIVDCNGWKGLDKAEFPRFINHEKLPSGHSFASLKKAFDERIGDICFKTVKGLGTCYANTLESHYLPLNSEQYRQACEALS